MLLNELEGFEARLIAAFQAFAASAQAPSTVGPAAFKTLPFYPVPEHPGPEPVVIKDALPGIEVVGVMPHFIAAIEGNP